MLDAGCAMGKLDKFQKSAHAFPPSDEGGAPQCVEMSRSDKGDGAVGGVTATSCRDGGRDEKDPSTDLSLPQAWRRDRRQASPLVRVGKGKPKICAHAPTRNIYNCTSSAAIPHLKPEKRVCVVDDTYPLFALLFSTLTPVQRGSFAPSLRRRRQNPRP